MKNVRVRYGEPHRVYHTYEHLAYMWTHFDEVASSMGLNEDQREDLYQAALYHDAVYNIPDPDRQNEKLSAELFVEENPDYPRPNVVYHAIMATADHILRPNHDAVTRCLIDLDLWILGETFEKYSFYTEDVQQEYGATDEQWVIGRGAFLESFLKRDQIYYTPAGRKREKLARKNLTEEYENLSNYTKEGTN